jgi:hypothetical protein
MDLGVHPNEDLQISNPKVHAVLEQRPLDVTSLASK